MNWPARRIAENLDRVRGRMAEAAIRCGRRPEEVQLIAVTKYVDSEVARSLVAAGCAALGESRPQELWDKAQCLADLPIQWHLIGHLQRNKVKRTLPLACLIHSLDSLRLLRAVDECAADLGRVVDGLLEVNCSQEAAKIGFSLASLAEAVDAASRLNGLRIRGLMTMASLEGGPDQARRDFARLRKTRDQLLPTCPSNVRLDELSMGMSDDFEVAIAEGATLVRIGSALFE